MKTKWYRMDGWSEFEVTVYMLWMLLLLFCVREKEFVTNRFAGYSPTSY